MMARYSTSPACEKGKSHIWDSKKRRHLKTDNGGTAWLTAIAEMKCKVLNAAEIGKQAEQAGKDGE